MAQARIGWPERSPLYLLVADDIHMSVMREGRGRRYLMMPMGVTLEVTKERVAISDSLRESAESSREGLLS